MTASPVRQQFAAVVKQNISLCREHYRLILKLPSFPSTAPGQFIQIACRDLNIDYDDSQTQLAYLRRPFSLAGRRDTSDGVELDIIHRVVGIGTDWLSDLQANYRVHILGPLGNRFELPPTDHTAVLVGGGVGIPPMMYLAQSLQNQKAIAFAGATTKDLLSLTINANGQAEEFARFNVPTILTTDDGSFGQHGFVTQALEKWLDASTDKKLIIYTCGPEPMMKRVAEIAMNRNLPCQIAVERAMACGMGTCQSCCIRVKKTDPSKPPLAGREWCYRLACTDGPIFRAADLLW